MSACMRKGVWQAPEGPWLPAAGSFRHAGPEKPCDKDGLAFHQATCPRHSLRQLGFLINLLGGGNLLVGNLRSEGPTDHVLFNVTCSSPPPPFPNSSPLECPRHPAPGDTCWFPASTPRSRVLAESNQSSLFFSKFSASMCNWNETSTLLFFLSYFNIGSFPPSWSLLL